MQSTLILSRENGSIIRTSGLISNSSSANPNSTLPASGEATSESYTNGRKESGIHSAEDVASSVWSFLTAAGSLVDELDKEDEDREDRQRVFHDRAEAAVIAGLEEATKAGGELGRVGAQLRKVTKEGMADFHREELMP